MTNFPCLVDTIKRVESEKDLGVFIDEKLNFRDHITKKVNIANRNLGIIFRSFTYMDKNNVLKSVQVYGAAPYRICNTGMVTTIQERQNNFRKCPKKSNASGKMHKAFIIF